MTIANLLYGVHVHVRPLVVRRSDTLRPSLGFLAGSGLAAIKTGSVPEIGSGIGVFFPTLVAGTHRTRTLPWTMASRISLASRSRISLWRSDAITMRSGDNWCQLALLTGVVSSVRCLDILAPSLLFTNQGHYCR